MDGKLQEPLKVPAKGSFVVTIPLTVNFDKMADGALNGMLDRQIDYALTTTLNSTIPILEKKTFTVKQAEVLKF